MKLYVIGVNYKTTPIEIREKFSIEQEEYERILSGIKKLEGISECALLSTCNRTEIHIFSEDSLADTGNIEKSFCLMKGLDIYNMKKYFYVYEGINAVKHIIKVASGMDSMILGEDQILGQFRKAYELSMKYRTSKAVLNTLSRLAVTSSKKIKTRNLLLGKVSSIAGQTGQLLEQLFGKELIFSNILVIGSGEIGTAVCQKLLEAGVENIYITRRNWKVTEELGINDHTRVKTIDYNDRYSYIDKSHVIIGATSSPHYTITQDKLEENLSDKTNKHIFIDLAVPRDFDEAINKIENIELYNIDRLKELKSMSIKSERQFDHIYIREQIDSHTEEFVKWYRKRNIYSGVQQLSAGNGGM
ncbi:MAG: hemA [Eubacterium sp.]|jgi:glutamyl-tRNA reductase|nr:hemA [Eubacterium sp.]